MFLYFVFNDPPKMFCYSYKIPPIQNQIIDLMQQLMYPYFCNTLHYL